MDILPSLAGAPIDIVSIYEVSGGHYDFSGQDKEETARNRECEVKPAFSLQMEIPKGFMKVER